MRGQKARSGPGVRPGFEGGQTPMYRRFPKLKGIAGGMGAGGGGGDGEGGGGDSCEYAQPSLMI